LYFADSACNLARRQSLFGVRQAGELGGVLAFGVIQTDDGVIQMNDVMALKNVMMWTVSER
jgi:hypothetical protein